MRRMVDMRFVWFLVVAAIVVLGVVSWIMHDMDKQMNETMKTLSKNAQIISWHVDEQGIVITVSVDESFYRLYTYANELNVSKPVTVVFKEGTPIAVVQENRAFDIRDWEKLETLEKMPEVKR